MFVDIDTFGELKKIITTGEVLTQTPMSKYTSFKAGGCADFLVIPGNGEELINGIDFLISSKTPHFVMGKGTNLLVRDGGFRGVIICLGKALGNIKVEGSEIRAQAGALLPEVAQAALAAGLTGFEFAAGIPGSVGGATYMNAGAYGGEIGGIIKTAKVLTGMDVKDYSAAEMGFSYRSSLLKEKGGILLEAVFSLEKGSQSQIKEKMREFAYSRQEKQPLTLPSAGSFFKRPPGYYAGKLIQDAGLMGLSIGGAMVSDLHAGFIVNSGKASARDIIDLMEIIRATVFDRSGVKLELEVCIIGEVSDGL
jgi:UDP-N-acetylmuramate dehydrogenase